MKNIIIEIIIAILIFFIIKISIVALYKIVDVIFKIPGEKIRKFDFWASLLILILFLYIWCLTIDSANGVLTLSNLEFYISFCLIGIFTISWSYFSWDVEHILVIPRLASKGERRMKKIVVYLLIFIFVVAQGYQQTLHSLDSNYNINILFSVTNNSVIVAAIAFDRLLNQVFNK